MSPSTVQETVTVTGEAPLIDLKNSSIGGNIDPKQVQDIPINGRKTGSVATLPVGGYYLAQTPLTHLSASLWFAIAYIILVPTVGAYYLNAWALGRVAPSTVAIYIYLQPLIAFAFAPLLLGERLNSRTWLAALLIFAGVALVTLASRSRTVEEVSERPEALGH